jgi:Tol biopolymer transport system component
MDRLFVILVASLLTGGMSFTSAQQGTAEAEKLLASGHHKAAIDGDLKGAIEEYRKAVAAAASNRALAAQALLRMAECHQKLGDAEAQAIYQRLAREYADQKDIAAIARARLGVETTAVAAGDRAVWTGPKVDVFGQVSPDGRYITYVDWGGDQNLIAHDLMTNTDRPLTVTGPSVGFSQFAEYSTISRDGRQVAYAWLNDKGRYDLRIVPLMGKAPSQPRVFFAGVDGMSIGPKDWSPDGRFVAVNIRRQDGTGQIGIVTILDGSLRVLRSVHWRGANKILFSPDGRFLAYDLPADGDEAQRHVHVMAVDASTESGVVVHASRNFVMAWAPDGRHLLFASDRTGETGLWAQPMAHGKPSGAAVLLRPNIASSISLGLTASGTMHVYRGRSANYVQVASLDLAAARVEPLPGSVQRFVGAGGGPSWSPDGKYLAYRTCDTQPRAVCTIEIATMETGQTRRLRPMLSYLGDPRWSKDGRSFLTDGTDVKGRRALYRIDAETGDLSFIHERPGAIVQWSPDERTIYYRLGGSIIERTLATGAERVLFRERARGNSISIKVSPDGKHIASIEVAGDIRTLFLIPIAGGSPQELWRTNPPESADGFALEWTPDSQALLVSKSWDSRRRERWLLPVAAPSQARRIEIDAEWQGAMGGLALHPDGRRVAFTAAAGDRGAEVWAIENVLPGTVARSK